MRDTASKKYKEHFCKTCKDPNFMWGLCVFLSLRNINGWIITRLGMRFVWLCICAFYVLYFQAKYERACCWLWTGLSTPKLCSFCLDLHLGIFRVHLASEIVWGEKTWKLFQQILTSTSSWSPSWDLLLASSLHNWAGLFNISAILANFDLFCLILTILSWTYALFGILFTGLKWGGVTEMTNIRYRVLAWQF